MYKCFIRSAGGIFLACPHLMEGATVPSPWNVRWTGTGTFQLHCKNLWDDDSEPISLSFLGAFALAETCAGTKFGKGSLLCLGNIEHKQSIFLTSVTDQHRYTHTNLIYLCSFSHTGYLQLNSRCVHVFFFSLPPSVGFFQLYVVQNNDVVPHGGLLSSQSWAESEKSI